MLQVPLPIARRALLTGSIAGVAASMFARPANAETRTILIDCLLVGGVSSANRAELIPTLAIGEPLVLKLTDVKPQDDFCRGRPVMTTVYVYTRSGQHLGEFAYSLVHPYVQMMKAGLELAAHVSDHPTERECDLFADISLVA